MKRLISALLMTAAVTQVHAQNSATYFNTADQTTNYEKLMQSWSNNIFEIGTFRGGTGSTRALRLGVTTTAGATSLTGGRVFSINAGVQPTTGLFDFSGGTTTAGSLVTFNSSAAGSTLQNLVSIQGTINQPSTGGYRALYISPYQQQLGSGVKYLIDAGVNSSANGAGVHTSQFTIDHAGNGYYSGTVGIGTNSDLKGKLHVAGTITSMITDAAGDNANIYLGNPNAASNTIDKRGNIWLDNDGKLKFRTTTGYGFAFRNQNNTADILDINDYGLAVGSQVHTTKFSVQGSAISTITQLATVADFTNGSTTVDRTRLNIANTYNNPTKAASAALLFSGYNNAGTGIESKWEIGTDFIQSGGHDLYFFNSGTGIGQMMLHGNGNVGIESVEPIAKFQVDDGVSSVSLGNANGESLKFGTGYMGFNAARSGTNWSVAGDGANNGGGVIYGDVYGNINFASLERNSGTARALTDADVKSKISFQIAGDGTTRAKKIVVETQNWPDYVFGEGYNLMPIDKVAEYIKKEKHLPGVPSAKEVEDKGVDLAEMNKVLLKKVEELTRYVVANDSLTKHLRSQVVEQGKQLALLQRRLKGNKKGTK